MNQQQRWKAAARKAVTTLRLKKLSTTDIIEVEDLCKEIQLAQFEMENDFSDEGIICSEIGKTTWQSFCRYGDRNKATPALILTWIDNRCTHAAIDCQAMYMTNLIDREITTEAVAGFMIEYDHGLNSYPPCRKVIDLKIIFKELTGFNYNKKFVDQFILQTKVQVHRTKDVPF